MQFNSEKREWDAQGRHIPQEYIIDTRMQHRVVANTTYSSLGTNVDTGIFCLNEQHEELTCIKMMKTEQKEFPDRGTSKFRHLFRLHLATSFVIFQEVRPVLI
jgi:hypothetical protein